MNAVIMLYNYIGYSIFIKHIEILNDNDYITHILRYKNKGEALIQHDLDIEEEIILGEQKEISQKIAIYSNVMLMLLPIKKELYI